MEFINQEVAFENLFVNGNCDVINIDWLKCNNTRVINFGIYMIL